jgi:hypothetical protein
MATSVLRTLIAATTVMTAVLTRAECLRMLCLHEEIQIRRAGGAAFTGAPNLLRKNSEN